MTAKNKVGLAHRVNRNGGKFGADNGAVKRE
jgi:hypothetical protein